MVNMEGRVVNDNSKIVRIVDILSMYFPEDKVVVRWGTGQVMRRRDSKGRGSSEGIEEFRKMRKVKNKKEKRCCRCFR
jgi:hypothetical protein